MLMKLMRRGSWPSSVSPRLWAVLGLTACVSCSSSDSKLRPQTPPDGGADADPPAAVVRAGPYGLRRLSTDEYRNTILDLFGAAALERIVPLPEDQLNVETGFIVPTPFGSPDEVARYSDSAEAVATQATENLEALLPCAAAADEACARQFIANMGRRAFRRPVLAAEADRLMQLYGQLSAPPLSLDFRARIQGVLSAILQAGPFLYHWELGDEAAQGVSPGVVRLTPYQLASRLSYFLWATAPDEELLEAASQDRLQTAEQVAGHAERMLQNVAKARRGMAAFYAQWLHIMDVETKVKNAGIFTLLAGEEGRALRTAMRAETEAFAAYVTLEGDHRLTTLLTAPFTFLNARLANLYGVTGVEGESLRRVDLPGDRLRAGVFTQPAWLMTTAGPLETSPTERGKFIRARLLCQQIPSPPPSLMVDTMLPPQAPGQSKRAQLTAHVTNPVCSSCHRELDPPGFAFEHFNAIGAYRTHDGNSLVDASGQLTGIDSEPVPFANAPDMMRGLSALNEVRSCVTKAWFSYALGRAPRTSPGEEEATSFATVERAFRQSEDLRALLVGIVSSDAFRHRAVTTEEGGAQ